VNFLDELANFSLHSRDCSILDHPNQPKIHLNDEMNNRSLFR
jgi:hypothetical protein